VVHYDIMRPFAKRFEHYANDPAIKELTTSGAALTVLTLAPNREVLLEQFIKRAADRDYVEWWDRGAGRVRSSGRSARRSTGSPARSRSS
jgi:hypothetical protein